MAEPRSAVACVRDLVERAAALGASDVHLDPERDGVRVRVRRDGVLVPLDRLPKAIGPRVVGRLKALASLLAYRTDVPQEGRIPEAASGIGQEVRVATYPSLHGERVALRLDACQRVPSLGELGLQDGVLRPLSDALRAPEGVVLVTGPSGSGKTTTLYALVAELAAAKPPRSIVTVEDPVERALDGVVQTQVHAPSGLDFPRALRSLLRQDPEVILVGEVRDRETARVALEAGLTGHLVLSTVHAGTGPRVFARLLDMGVAPFVLTTAVRGVLAQRLLRRRCAPCHGEGCSSCAGTGYAGRLLVSSWLGMGDPLRRAILDRQDGEALARAAAVQGMTTLREAARGCVQGGETTETELERVLGRAPLPEPRS